MVKVAMIIAFKDFRDEELFHTQAALESLGHDTVLFSSEKGEAKGSEGGIARVYHTIEEINAEEYGAIVFVGGSGSSIYFNNETAIKIAKDAYSKGKTVAAICIAPSILANAGLLKGKRATCFSSEQANLTEKGAKHSGKSVEVDGRIITANGPAAAKNFGRQIGKLI